LLNILFAYKTIKFNGLAQLDSLKRKPND